ncbi:hypothetical protein [Nitrincola alkalilacustris]|uniref:hypothetical protein n=1 Tax=Nitrincola alkalilacustris TaxID=1571224 RepID=UPI00124CE387|nr:hypothetical protein [Nitrincola alkalilacustris]
MSKLTWFAPGHPAQIVIGFVIWSIWFIAMYGGLSVACQLAPPEVEKGAFTWLNGGLIAFTLLVFALLLFLAWRSGRYCASKHKESDDAVGFERFVGYVSTVLYLIAAVATLAGGLPVLVLSPCS